MMKDRIISEDQALQILKNDLRKQALERYAPELKSATEQRRAEIMAQIDREIQEAVRRRRAESGPFGPFIR
jgi:Skp family chaperone for outer membrane proteins